MPSVQVLHEKYQDNPNVVILAMNTMDDNEKMNAWWKKNEYTFPSLHDADDLANEYGVRVFPTSHLIGPDGKVIETQIGSAYVLESALEKALKADAE